MHFLKSNKMGLTSKFLIVVTFTTVLRNKRKGILSLVPLPSWLKYFALEIKTLETKNEEIKYEAKKA